MSQSLICRRCGRALKNPASVVNAMGPVCAKKFQYEGVDDLLSTLNDDFFIYGLVCKRENNQAQTNVPHRKVLHSPTGLEWGYGGSGPAELALNTLLMLVDDATADRLHQNFKWDFISPMPRDGGNVPIDTIKAWLRERGATI